MRKVVKQNKKPVSTGPFGHRLFLCVAVLGAIIFGSHRSEVAAQQTTPITGCQTFWSSGTYVLTTDATVNLSGLPYEGVCWRFQVPNVTIDGQGHTLTLTGGGSLVSITTTFPVDHVTIKNIITNGGILVRENYSNYFTLQNSHTAGVTMTGSDYSLIQDNVINGELRTDAYVQGAYIDPSIGNTILRNTVTSTADRAGYFDSGASTTCPRTDNVIRDNTFINNSTITGTIVSAFRIVCGTHAVVTGNTIHSTGTGIGFYMRDQSDDGYFENNTFISDHAEAIRMASGLTTVPLPSRNVFHNNFFRSGGSEDTSHGFWFFQGIGSDNLFEYNTFTGIVGGLIVLTDSYAGHSNGSNTYDHNTFYSTGTNHLFRFDETQSTSHPDTWTNNIFSYTGSNIITFTAWSFSRYVGNHNLFQNRAGAVSFAPNGNTLAAWRANSGNVDDINSIEANPLFNNPGNFDYTLQASSPARGAGSGGTDIGAKPYGSEPPPICTESWSCGAWSACSNSTQTRTCTDANSCGTTTNRPPLSQSCDSTNPTVSITAPTNGATVNGTVTVSATAADNAGVAGVTFYANGVAIGSEDTSAPYSVNWNTTGIVNGSTRTLTAVARDTSNNTTTSGGISVTINPPICTESWSCGAWSACANSLQSRTCTDANNCGTTNTRPPLTQSCVMPDTTAPAAILDLQAGA